ncbi:uncharacterized protein EV422DRAFT_534238 [Fimicolochytrium jonesii]|uniref:uncharacterized protein n=1 Tax=Fimicolochytrium jonesii TaxID=1396493 RepID=UPI0022FEF9D2|nr:uncharacterized protein EV422DRAFT_534238 [Fimicolochytrium jonesii]KAI8819760.1 hypothetical protein EV422DRAFT_534238 [Fimicolochytrium jonesii]
MLHARHILRSRPLRLQAGLQRPLFDSSFSTANKTFLSVPRIAGLPSIKFYQIIRSYTANTGNAGEAPTVSPPDAKKETHDENTVASAEGDKDDEDPGALPSPRPHWMSADGTFGDPSRISIWAHWKQGDEFGKHLREEKNAQAALRSWAAQMEDKAKELRRGAEILDEAGIDLGGQGDTHMAEISVGNIDPKTYWTLVTECGDTFSPEVCYWSEHAEWLADEQGGDWTKEKELERLEMFFSFMPKGYKLPWVILKR